MIPTPELEDKKISSWKRLGVFCLDGIMTLITFALILFTIGNLSIKTIAQNQIATMNIYYQEICDDKGLPTTIEKQYGLVIIDYNNYMDEKINEGLDIETANQKYNEDLVSIEKSLSEIKEYVSSYNSFYGIYQCTIILSAFIPLLIYQLIIPLFNKKRQTIAMKIFKFSIVDTKENTFASQYKVLLRFFLIFIVEFICVYLILGILGEIFIALGSFALISLSKNKIAIHDGIAKLKIIPLENAYSTIETNEI